MATKLLKNALFIFFISVNTLFSQNEKYHIIKKGETLYSISKNYNISVNYLKISFLMILILRMAPNL